MTMAYQYDGNGRLVASADSSGQVTQYVYDAAGNILEVLAAVQTDTPALNSVVPDTLRQGQTVTVTLSGARLPGARVISPSSALAVSRTQAREDSVVFSLAADLAAPLGPQACSVVNNIGATGFSLNAKYGTKARSAKGNRQAGRRG